LVNLILWKIETCFSKRKGELMTDFFDVWNLFLRISNSKHNFILETRRKKVIFSIFQEILSFS